MMTGRGDPFSRAGRTRILAGEPALRAASLVAGCPNVGTRLTSVTSTFGLTGLEVVVLSPAAQEALVETYRLIERVGKKRPTNGQCFAIVREMGHRFTNDEAKHLLVSFRNTGHRRSSDGPLPGLDLRTGGPSSGHLRAISGGPTRAGVVLTPFVPTVVPNGTTRVTPQRTARKRVEADELPSLPGDSMPDVLRLQANDASTRRDGKISDGVLESDLAVLRRAFAKQGAVALEHGITVALNRGLGVRFAAGCVRRYDSARDERPAFFARPESKYQEVSAAQQAVVERFREMK